MSDTFKSTPGRVIIELVHEDKVTESGFVLPKHTQPLPKTATVISVGADTKDDKGNVLTSPVQVGDEIVFDHAKAYGIQLEGKDYVTVTWDGILAVLRPE